MARDKRQKPSYFNREFNNDSRFKRIQSVVHARTPTNIEQTQGDQDNENTAPKPQTYLHIKITENGWRDIKQAANARDPFTFKSDAEHSLNYLPIAFAFGLRGSASNWGGAAIMVAASLARPLVSTVINNTPFVRKRLKKAWHDSLSHGRRNTFTNDDQKKLQNLGQANIDELIHATIEAVTFTDRWENSTYWTREIGFHRPLKLQRLYGQAAIGFDPSSQKLDIKPGSGETFQFQMHMKSDKYGEPVLTNVAYEVVPNPPGRGFTKHGLDTLPIRQFDPKTGKEVITKPVELNIPIHITPENEQQLGTTKQRAKEIDKLLHPRKKPRQAREHGMKFFRKKPGSKPSRDDGYVYATSYKPTGKAAILSPSAHQVVHEYIHDMAELTTIDFQDLKSHFYAKVKVEDRNFKKMMKRWKAIHEELRKETDPKTRHELKVEQGEIDEKLNKIGGEFVLYRTRIQEDGLPSNNLADYEKVRTYHNAQYFFQHIEDEIKSKGYEPTSFWNIRKLANADDALLYDKDLETDLNRTIKTLRETDTEYFINAYTGALYAKRFNEQTGDYELLSGGLTKTLLPHKIDTMDIVRASPKEEVVEAALRELMTKHSLIENPYRAIEDYKLYVEQKVSQSLTEQAQELLGEQENKEPKKSWFPHIGQ